MTAVFYRYHHSGSLAGQTKQPSLARAQAQGPGPPQDRQESLPAKPSFTPQRLYRQLAEQLLDLALGHSELSHLSTGGLL